MTNEEELRIITLLMQNRRFDQSIDSFSRMMQPKFKIPQDNTEDIARYQRKTKKLPLILSIFATSIAFVGLLITLFKPTENVELREEVEELKEEIRN